MSNNPRDRWNSRFSSDEYLFGTAPNAFLANQKSRLAAGHRVLSIADGEGRNGVFMAQQGCDVLAVDFSSVALAKSQALAAERNVKINTLEVDHNKWTPDPDTYDIVVAIFVQFADPELRSKIFSDIKSALKPGGLLLMEGYRPEQIEYGTGGPPHAENMYTEEMLREAFSDLDIIELKSYDAEIDEGPGHAGLSALIDLIAIKS
ncbi:MAG: class I SAM-dependent methyltransferase [Alphaproteobacteria bacterium]|jgi:SAM-dependent methyltransferase|nr:class I SAM-dependent methyltransferase [Alphaproteobacteria bacterium]MBT4084110.1 class I SAM-dependent methyltransferase [Alphaproteobacteria bacterium]MBT4544376.1 class I SAM-dependent methyltransferase [Alphaproteobacteria bacterium]MBT7745015.1 class I SAM-dependent methyltransferase [Alphaproteobacteria bacterium]